MDSFPRLLEQRHKQLCSRLEVRLLDPIFCLFKDQVIFWIKLSVIIIYN